jgi:hypothetical protein
MTPDELAAARIARRQSLAEVETLCASVRRHVAAGTLPLALPLLCKAHEEFGGVGRWPTQAETDRQRVQQVQVVLLAAQSAVVAACSGSRPARPQDVVSLLVQILEVLRSRDGVPITDAQIEERARNGAMALCSEFDVRVGASS